MYQRIAYITDLHFDEDFPVSLGVDAKKNWEIILDDLVSKKIGTIVLGGDVGSKTAHPYFFDSLKDYQISISLGNHDVYDEIIQHYKNGIDTHKNGLYYSHDNEFYRFIFMDSSTELISQSQLEWFHKELVTDKHILLFVHHPILAINALVDKQFCLSDRHKIESELRNINNKVTIFSAHYHFDDHTISNNIEQYVTPAVSYQVEKLPDEIKVNGNSFGYRMIELKEQEISTKVILF